MIFKGKKYIFFLEIITCDLSIYTTGLKNRLVCLYLQVPEAKGQVKTLIFLMKIKYFPMPKFFVMQGKCLIYDILRPVQWTILTLLYLAYIY